LVKLFLISLFFINSVPVSVITVDKETKPLQFARSLEYYVDASDLDLSAIRDEDLNWKKPDSGTLNLGYTGSAVWLKFTIDNRSGEDLFFEINNPQLNRIEFYTPDSRGAYNVKYAGDTFPFSQREIIDKNFVFSIPYIDGEATYYVKLLSTYIIVLSPAIWREKDKSNRLFKLLPGYWFYLGILFALLCYNILIYISIREREYLNLILVIISWVMSQFCSTGFGFMYIWPDYPAIQERAYPFFTSLIGISVGLFIRQVLETKKKFPVIHYLIYLHLIPYTIILIYSIFAGEKAYRYIMYVLLYGPPLNLICITYAMFKKSRPAIFLFIALSVNVLGNVMAALVHNNILPGFFIVISGTKFGSAWLVIMFSLALADKINTFKNQLQNAYREIEKREEAYRSIFNGTNDAICILDSEKSCVLDANRAMLDMFQLDYRSIKGKNADYFSATDEGYSAKKVKEYLRGMTDENTVMFEWLLMRNTGEKIWADITAKKVLINGEKRIMIVIRDVSERKKAEDEQEKMLHQLTQAQKMEAVGTLAGGLAHDFNNILTGILGSSNLAEKHLIDGGLDRNRLLKYINIIKEASLKAASVVKQLLTITIKNELKIGKADLNNIIKDVIDICVNSFPKSVKIMVKYYDCDAMIDADISGLNQVFLNIMVNASHAVTIMRDKSENEGGDISLKIDKQYADDLFCRINPDAVNGLNYFMVSVQDNGCGIDKDKIGKIFDPFFTTKSDSSGTGLGLSMVYSIVKMHNGLIKVYSEKNSGTTFNVYLPESTFAGKGADVEKESVIPGHGTILVIDDESYVRTVAHDMLEQIGYDVITEPNGLSGIETYRRNSGIVDMVLLDVSMPGLSGIDTFSELRKINPSIKIIMSSGFGMDERVGAVLGMGADSFIQKPYTNIQLSKAIHKVLAEKKTESE